MSLTRASADFYAPGNSWIHRLDPRIKMLMVSLASIITLLWVNVFLLAAALAVVHFVLLSARYPWERLRTIWRAIAPLLIIVVIVWPLFDQSGSARIHLGPLTITALAMLHGTITALRLAAVSFIFIIWIGTTDAQSLVRGFVRLGLPFQWGMSVTIGLRFIPTFAGIFQTVSDAQQSRGLIFHGNLLRRSRQYLPILVASLVTALRASEQLAMTLESRGFGATRERTVFRDLRMRFADWISLILILTSAAALIYSTLALNLGRHVIALW